MWQHYLHPGAEPGGWGGGDGVGGGVLDTSCPCFTLTSLFVILSSSEVAETYFIYFDFVG